MTSPVPGFLSPSPQPVRDECASDEMGVVQGEGLTLGQALTPISGFSREPGLAGTFVCTVKVAKMAGRLRWPLAKMAVFKITKSFLHYLY